MRSLVVIFLTHFVVRSSALCFPGESLQDCVRRQQEEDRTKQQDDDENNQATPCLGVSDKEGFIGECKKSSSCAEVFSESLNCLFSTVCCKKLVGVRDLLPGARPREINGIRPRQFEDVNQDNCGLRGNNKNLKALQGTVFSFRSTEFCSRRRGCT